MSNISKVIGEGTYGCVLKPSLKCKGKQKISYENKVSKVLSNSDAKDELAEYDNVDRADKNADFYLGKPESCNINDTLQSNKSAIRQCKIGDQVLERLNNYKLILMGDGGVNIVTYAKSVKNWSKTSANKRKCEIFLLESLRLFAGLIKFKEHGLIHHDLKAQNIVYNEEKERLNFIDFGVMQDKEKSLVAAENNRYRFSIFHWSYPWENLYLDKRDFMRFSKMPRESRVDDFGKIINDFVNRVSNHVPTHLHYFFGYVLNPDLPNRDDYRNERSKYFADYRDFIGSGIDSILYDNFAEKCLDTVDVYGLGLTLMHWFLFAKKHLDKELVSNLEILFYQMVRPNLLGRFRIEEATCLFEHILKQSGLLKKYNKEIIDHIVVKSAKTNKDDIMKILFKAVVDVPPPAEIANLTPGEVLEPCPKGKERNPKTKRCNNTCKTDYSRDENFKCKKNKTIKNKFINELKMCNDHQERNPKTGRCVKLCKPGYERDDNFKCVKSKK